MIFFSLSISKDRDVQMFYSCVRTLTHISESRSPLSRLSSDQAAGMELGRLAWVSPRHRRPLTGTQNDTCSQPLTQLYVPPETTSVPPEPMAAPTTTVGSTMCVCRSISMVCHRHPHGAQHLPPPTTQHSYKWTQSWY